MKVRHGFVSNSSTTSFCIYGIYVYEDIDILLKKYDVDDIGNLCHILREKTGLSVYEMYDDDSIYIGREFCDIGENETGGEFKKNTREKIKEIFGKEVDCELLEETIPN
jgi:hypothetical protein